MEIDRTHPVNHTGVIASTRDALEKLWWNYQIFESQLSARDGGMGQGFAIIDYAVASGSVHAWLCAEYSEAVTAERIPPVLGLPFSISHTLQQRVRFWSVLQAIANATKHRNLSSYWPGGVNIPALQPDGASAYIWKSDDTESMAELTRELLAGTVWYENIFHTPGSEERVLAREALSQNYQDWHSLIYEAGPDF